MKTYADLQTEIIEKHGQGLAWEKWDTLPYPFCKIDLGSLIYFLSMTDIEHICFEVENSKIDCINNNPKLAIKALTSGVKGCEKYTILIGLEILYIKVN
jgi:hypothetical protein